MNQIRFENTYRQSWDSFRSVLESMEKQKKNSTGKVQPTLDFPLHYRQICNHYSLAKARHYRPTIVDELHDLVLRGHFQLYRKKTNYFWGGLRFITTIFPQTLRSHSIYFWLACLLFLVPAGVTGLMTLHDPVLIYSIVDELQVVNMEEMYTPDDRKIGRTVKRTDESDLTMFGFYIFNNISIGFRTFAGGIIFGIGSVFFLLFNGITIGGIAGYLSHTPFVRPFWQFVCGHGSFELTAIIICGAAGLVLGDSLLRPGMLRRRDSLRLRAPVALQLASGGGIMLLVAAFIEAFWSSSGFPSNIKYVVAGLLWILVISYLSLAGRKIYES